MIACPIVFRGGGTVRDGFCEAELRCCESARQPDTDGTGDADTAIAAIATVSTVAAYRNSKRELVTSIATGSTVPAIPAGDGSRVGDGDA